MVAGATRPVSEAELATLAAFRYALARFLGFSESAAATAGLTPHQYQALLALRGFGGRLSVGELAERLRIHHHSAVGLVDRLQRLGLVTRARDPGDRRRVFVAPTARGAARMAGLAAVHRDELRQTAKALRELLDRLAPPRRSPRKAARRRRQGRAR